MELTTDTVARLAAIGWAADGESGFMTLAADAADDGRLERLAAQLRIEGWCIACERKHYRRAYMKQWQPLDDRQVEIVRYAMFGSNALVALADSLRADGWDARLSGDGARLTIHRRLTAAETDALRQLAGGGTIHVVRPDHG